MQNISVPINVKIVDERTNRIVSDLMQKYADSVLRMCYLYLKDYHLAEDVTQETFIRVMKNYDKFRRESSIKTWIMQIAINLCKNQMKTWWYKRQNFDDVPEIAYDPCYDGFMDRQELFDKINKLSPKYKEIILLYFYQELSVSEIAEVLKLKGSAVKVRLFRAREQLKLSFMEDKQYE
ncbi:sigma-70 family RNA polymerase sigma factor [Anaerocolumna aminovalerica]|uniref:sigma-70 family RNA polymerase sigma factor n=1 Tax=Anaerocolumna aminovalerica TaxID=1527 RepID=UPI000BE47994|nr:sigma-70 family RNA polymerase sigma factor [Anaerocolumna aminovalerica]